MDRAARAVHGRCPCGYGDEPADRGVALRRCSSLGYRLAGFRVVLASELNVTARQTYRLNADPATVTEGAENVTVLSGAAILEAAGGELDVLDGSPPCQGFSHAGRRRAEDARNALYYHFVRLVGETQPRAFVAENVVGFASGKMREAHFLPIVAMLRGHGYRVGAFRLDASWLGVPQARERVVLIGLRKDLGAEPAAPQPFSHQTVIADALPDVARLIALPTQVRDAVQFYRRQEESIPAAMPAPTLLAGGLGGRSVRSGEDWRAEHRDGQTARLTAVELLALSSFPPDFELPEDASLAQVWKLVGNAVPPLMARAWAEQIAAALVGAA